MGCLEIGRDRGVVTVTMNRPERRNAISMPMWHELRAAFQQISDSPDDRVVVLTGAGGHFCSGTDLAEMDVTQTHSLHGMRLVSDTTLALHRISKPTIAKVRGDAVGAGCNFALGCDLVLASETVRFSEIFSRRGLSVDAGGSWILPRLIGMHRAKEMAFFADLIDGPRAAELGLVNRVVPDDELDDLVARWARTLADGPPVALSMTKRLLSQSFEVTMDRALEDEARCQSINFSTEDCNAAVEAFLDKSAPVFRGR